MKYIIVAIVSFLIGYNFTFIHRSILKFILKLKYREKKYFEELKIDNEIDTDFWDIDDIKRMF